MASKIETAVRNAERLATALERKQERQAKSTVRMNHRLTRAEDSLSRAEASLLKAQERVARANARLEKVREDKSKLGEKYMGIVDEAAARAKQAAGKAERLKAAPASPKKTATGGSVTDEDGGTTNITSKAAKLVKKLIGRKMKGSFAPLDCEEAVSILDACSQKGTVGNIFTVQLKGRKNDITFSVEADGLAFQVAAFAVV